MIAIEPSAALIFPVLVRTILPFTRSRMASASESMTPLLVRVKSVDQGSPDRDGLAVDVAGVVERRPGARHEVDADSAEADDRPGVGDMDAARVDRDPRGRRDCAGVGVGDLAPVGAGPDEDPDPAERRALGHEDNAVIDELVVRERHDDGAEGAFGEPTTTPDCTIHCWLAAVKVRLLALVGKRRHVLFLLGSSPQGRDTTPAPAISPFVCRLEILVAAH